MRRKSKIVKNALANLARSGTGGAIALFLPAFLVRHMNQLDFAIWMLVLQIAGYSVYLDFGLQTAVGRYVAFASEKQDFAQRDAIFSTALAGLSAACCACIGLLLFAVHGAGWLFPKIPGNLLPEMRFALLTVGISTALSLPASAWGGVFVGLQRNEIPAFVFGASKLITAIGLMLAVQRGRAIVLMAIVMATVNIASYVTQYLLIRKLVPNLTFCRDLISPSTVRELGSYCLSLTVWSFSSILVSGLDLVLVGRIQFTEVPFYSIASSMVTFVAGAQYALFSAIMPHAATVHAQKDSTRLGDLVAVSTRIGVVLLIITGVPLLVFATPTLSLWVGIEYAGRSYQILVVLLIANMIRLVGLPYSTVLIGSAQQKLVTTSPLLEGVVNLLASVILGRSYGAIGIAWGTLIGAVVGLVAHIFYNLPRTKPVISISIRRFLLFGMITPFIAMAPFLTAAIFTVYGSLPASVAIGALLATAVLGVALSLMGNLKAASMPSPIDQPAINRPFL